jgi:DNA-binding transcriptional ArsR family regulator
LIILEEIFTTLAHPKRRNILLDLFYEREGTITHFKQDLKLKTGTLYHHLNILTQFGLVEQTREKSYRLTNKGIEAIQPLFTDRIEEFNEIKNELYDPIKVAAIPVKQPTTMSMYFYIDSLLSILFLKVNMFLAIVVIQYLTLINFLGVTDLGLLGSHLFSATDFLISILSLTLTFTITLALIWVFPKLLGKSEPLTKELILLASLLYVPLTIYGSLIMIFYELNLETLITSEILVLFEFMTQLYWLFWIYIIFRRINGLDYIKALLGSFVINYSWLTIIMLFNP